MTHLKRQKWISPTQGLWI